MPRLTPDQVRLVEENRDVVVQATHRAFQRQGIPRTAVEFEELHGALSEQFCHIARRWNGSGSFRGYAMKRLQWAVIDYIRDNGPRTRGGKERIKTESWTEMDVGSDGRLSLGSEAKIREEDREPGFEEEYLGTEFLAYALEHVSEREQRVLWMRYVEGITLREIGEIMGVTESRVSQIESAALRKLRSDRDVVETAAGIRG